MSIPPHLLIQMITSVSMNSWIFILHSGLTSNTALICCSIFSSFGSFIWPLHYFVHHCVCVCFFFLSFPFVLCFFFSIRRCPILYPFCPHPRINHLSKVLFPGTRESHQKQRSVFVTTSMPLFLVALGWHSEELLYVYILNHCIHMYLWA